MDFAVSLPRSPLQSPCKFLYTSSCAGLCAQALVQSLCRWPSPPTPYRLGSWRRRTPCCCITGHGLCAWSGTAGCVAHVCVSACDWDMRACSGTAGCVACVCLLVAAACACVLGLQGAWCVIVACAHVLGQQGVGHVCVRTSVCGLCTWPGTAGCGQGQQGFWCSDSFVWACVCVRARGCACEQIPSVGFLRWRCAHHTHPGVHAYAQGCPLGVPMLGSARPLRVRFAGIKQHCRRLWYNACFASVAADSLCTRRLGLRAREGSWCGRPYTGPPSAWDRVSPWLCAPGQHLLHPVHSSSLASTEVGCVAGGQCSV